MARLEVEEVVSVEQVEGLLPWYVSWSGIWVGALSAFALLLVFGLTDIAVGAHQLGQRIASWHECYLVNDTTVEKLGELLNHHPNGLLLFRDELSGWHHTMERPGHENDRAFYCEAWNGTSAYTYDRIGRGTLHIRAACLSVLSGRRPDRSRGTCARSAAGG